MAVSNAYIALKPLQYNGDCAPERDGTAMESAIFASSST
jgi:hypothetical protein